jgi:hypothetical protein
LSFCWIYNLFDGWNGRRECVRKTPANYSVKSSTAMPISSFPQSQITFKAALRYILPNTNATFECWDKKLNTTVHLNAYYSPSEPVLQSKWRQLTPYGIFDFLVADFHNETSNMNDLDSYDYTTRRCDELYPGYVLGRPFNQYFLSVVRENCIRVNSKDYLTNSNIVIIPDVVFGFYKQYGLLISPIIMACFALMNIRLFLTKKSVQNEFVLLVFVQSWSYIFWSIFYVLFNVMYALGVFGLKFFSTETDLIGFISSNAVILIF